MGVLRNFTTILGTQVAASPIASPLLDIPRLVNRGFPGFDNPSPPGKGKGPEPEVQKPYDRTRPNFDHLIQEGSYPGPQAQHFRCLNAAYELSPARKGIFSTISPAQALCQDNLGDMIPKAGRCASIASSMFFGRERDKIMKKMFKSITSFCKQAEVPFPWRYQDFLVASELNGAALDDFYPRHPTLEPPPSDGSAGYRGVNAMVDEFKHSHVLDSAMRKVLETQPHRATGVDQVARRAVNEALAQSPCATLSDFQLALECLGNNEGSTLLEMARAVAAHYTIVDPIMSPRQALQDTHQALKTLLGDKHPHFFTEEQFVEAGEAFADFEGVGKLLSDQQFYSKYPNLFKSSKWSEAGYEVTSNLVGSSHLGHIFPPTPRLANIPVLPEHPNFLIDEMNPKDSLANYPKEKLVDRLVDKVRVQPVRPDTIMPNPEGRIGKARPPKNVPKKPQPWKNVLKQDGPPLPLKSKDPPDDVPEAFKDFKNEVENLIPKFSITYDNLALLRDRGSDSDSYSDSHSDSDSDAWETDRVESETSEPPGVVPPVVGPPGGGPPGVVPPVVGPPGGGPPGVVPPVVGPPGGGPPGGGPPIVGPPGGGPPGGGPPAVGPPGGPPGGGPPAVGPPGGPPGGGPPGGGLPEIGPPGGNLPAPPNPSISRWMGLLSEVPPRKWIRDGLSIFGALGAFAGIGCGIAFGLFGAGGDDDDDEEEEEDDDESSEDESNDEEEPSNDESNDEEEPSDNESDDEEHSSDDKSETKEDRPRITKPKGKHTPSISSEERKEMVDSVKAMMQDPEKLMARLDEMGPEKFNFTPQMERHVINLVAGAEDPGAAFQGEAAVVMNDIWGSPDMLRLATSEWAIRHHSNGYEFGVGEDIWKAIGELADLVAERNTHDDAIYRYIVASTVVRTINVEATYDKKTQMVFETIEDSVVDVANRLGLKNRENLWDDVDPQFYSTYLSVESDIEKRRDETPIRNKMGEIIALYLHGEAGPLLAKGIGARHGELANTTLVLENGRTLYPKPKTTLPWGAAAPSISVSPSSPAQRPGGVPSPALSSDTRAAHSPEKVPSPGSSNTVSTTLNAGVVPAPTTGKQKGLPTPRFSDSKSTTQDPKGMPAPAAPGASSPAVQGPEGASTPTSPSGSSAAHEPGEVLAPSSSSYPTGQGLGGAMGPTIHDSELLASRLSTPTTQGPGGNLAPSSVGNPGEVMEPEAHSSGALASGLPNPTEQGLGNEPAPSAENSPGVLMGPNAPDSEVLASGLSTPTAPRPEGVLVPSAVKEDPQSIKETNAHNSQGPEAGISNPTQGPGGMPEPSDLPTTQDREILVPGATDPIPQGAGDPPASAPPAPVLSDAPVAHSQEVMDPGASNPTTQDAGGMPAPALPASEPSDVTAQAPGGIPTPAPQAPAPQAPVPQAPAPQAPAPQAPAPQAPVPPVPAPPAPVPPAPVTPEPMPPVPVPPAPAPAPPAPMPPAPVPEQADPHAAHNEVVPAAGLRLNNTSQSPSDAPALAASALASGPLNFTGKVLTPESSSFIAQGSGAILAPASSSSPTTYGPVGVPVPEWLNTTTQVLGAPLPTASGLLAPHKLGGATNSTVQRPGGVSLPLPSDLPATNKVEVLGSASSNFTTQKLESVPVPTVPSASTTHNANYRPGGVSWNSTTQGLVDVPMPTSSSSLSTSNSTTPNSDGASTNLAAQRLGGDPVPTSSNSSAEHRLNYNSVQVSWNSTTQGLSDVPVPTPSGSSAGYSPKYSPGRVSSNLTTQGLDNIPVPTSSNFTTQKLGSAPVPTSSNFTTQPLDGVSVSASPNASAAYGPKFNLGGVPVPSWSNTTTQTLEILPVPTLSSSNSSATQYPQDDMDRVQTFAPSNSTAQKAESMPTATSESSGSPTELNPKYSLGNVTVPTSLSSTTQKLEGLAVTTPSSSDLSMAHDLKYYPGKVPTSAFNFSNSTTQRLGGASMTLPTASGLLTYTADKVPTPGVKFSNSTTQRDLPFPTLSGSVANASEHTQGKATPTSSNSTAQSVGDMLASSVSPDLLMTPGSPHPTAQGSVQASQRPFVLTPPFPRPENTSASAPPAPVAVFNSSSVITPASNSTARLGGVSAQASQNLGNTSTAVLSASLVAFNFSKSSTLAPMFANSTAYIPQNTGNVSVPAASSTLVVAYSTGRVITPASKFTTGLGVIAAQASQNSGNVPAPAASIAAYNSSRVLAPTPKFANSTAHAPQKTGSVSLTPSLSASLAAYNTSKVPTLVSNSAAQILDGPVPTSSGLLAAPNSSNVLTHASNHTMQSLARPESMPSGFTKAYNSSNALLTPASHSTTHAPSGSPAAAAFNLSRVSTPTPKFVNATAYAPQQTGNASVVGAAPSSISQPMAHNLEGGEVAPASNTTVQGLDEPVHASAGSPALQDASMPASVYSAAHAPSGSLAALDSSRVVLVSTSKIANSTAYASQQAGVVSTPAPSASLAALDLSRASASGSKNATAAHTAQKPGGVSAYASQGLGGESVPRPSDSQDLGEVPAPGLSKISSSSTHGPGSSASAYFSQGLDNIPTPAVVPSSNLPVDQNLSQALASEQPDPTVQASGDLTAQHALSTSLMASSASSQALAHSSPKPAMQASQGPGDGLAPVSQGLGDAATLVPSNDSPAAQTSGGVLAPDQPEPTTQGPGDVSAQALSESLATSSDSSQTQALAPNSPKPTVYASQNAGDVPAPVPSEDPLISQSPSEVLAPDQPNPTTAQGPEDVPIQASQGPEDLSASAASDNTPAAYNPGGDFTASLAPAEPTGQEFEDPPAADSTASSVVEQAAPPATDTDTAASPATDVTASPEVNKPALTPTDLEPSPGTDSTESPVVEQPAPPAVDDKPAPLATDSAASPATDLPASSVVGSAALPGTKSGTPSSPAPASQSSVAPKGGLVVDDDDDEEEAGSSVILPSQHLVFLVSLLLMAWTV